MWIKLFTHAHTYHLKKLISLFIYRKKLLSQLKWRCYFHRLTRICSFSSLTYSEQQRCNSTTTTTNPVGVTENTFLESTTAVVTTKTSVNKKPVGFLIKPTFQWSLREKKNSLWLDCHDHFHWHFPCNFSRLTVSILSASQKKGHGVFISKLDQLILPNSVWSKRN